MTIFVPVETVEQRLLDSKRRSGMSGAVELVVGQTVMTMSREMRSSHPRGPSLLKREALRPAFDGAT